MTDDILERANKLNKEIAQLECFIRYAKNCWIHLSFFEKLKRGKPLIHHKGYGAFKGGMYELPDELSERILDVMEKYLEEQREKYKQLGQGE